MQPAQVQQRRQAAASRRCHVSAAAVLTLLAVLTVSAAPTTSAYTWPASAFPYGDAASDASGRADDAGFEVSLRLALLTRMLACLYEMRAPW